MSWGYHVAGSIVVGVALTFHQTKRVRLAVRPVDKALLCKGQQMGLDRVGTLEAELLLDFLNARRHAFTD